MKKISFFLLFVLIFLLAGLEDLSSCTIFRLKAQDGSWMVARSMEFGVDLHYDLITVPRNHNYASPFSAGVNGLKWKTNYGYVGVASFGMDYGLSDGMNEKGLVVGVLWYETDMKWQQVTVADSSIALSQTMFCDWMLGLFATTDELRQAIPSVKIFNYVDPVLGMAPTCHFIVYDAKGGCIVVEFDQGNCHIYDNPLGIMTNAPSFPWQINNLRQYINMSPLSPEPISFSGVTLNATGHGSGMFGLPGDYSPPSRFVRLAVLTRFVDPQPDALHNLNLCNHVINTFTIPFGVIYDLSADGKPVRKESTQWVTFRDQTNLTLYFKTYDNSTLRKIDLKKINFSVKEIKRIPMFGSPETITEITQ